MSGSTNSNAAGLPSKVHVGFPQNLPTWPGFLWSPRHIRTSSTNPEALRPFLRSSGFFPNCRWQFRRLRAAVCRCWCDRCSPTGQRVRLWRSRRTGPRTPSLWSARRTPPPGRSRFRTRLALGQPPTHPWLFAAINGRNWPEGTHHLIHVSKQNHAGQIVN